MHDVWFIVLVFGLLAAVTATLGMGFYALFRGGSFGRAWSNRLMRLRIALQFTAILVLAAAIFLTHHGR
jgi:membrane protein implicated in regulation of membrane protease activity